MCGRYTQSKDLQTLEIRFGFTAPDTAIRQRYNVAPMQYAPVVTLEHGERRLADNALGAGAILGQGRGQRQQAD